MDDVLSRSLPIVETGEAVEAGDLIAVPADDGISNAQHAPMDGTVTSTTDARVEIQAAGPPSRRTFDAEHDTLLYWTACVDCGAYVPRPELEHLGPGIWYRCRDCR